MIRYILAACAIIASTLFAMPADASTVPDWQRITIQPLTQRQKITIWGLDLKNPAQIRQFSKYPGYARRVSANHRLSVVRIVIRADAKGVDANGRLIESYYADTIQAVRNVRLGNPQVRVLASRKTIIDCSTFGDTRCLDYAPSLKVDGQLSTARYGRLIAEYLKFMRRSGLRVSFLSLDNEPVNNEGNLTPTRFAAVAGTVHRNYPFTMPLLVGNDNVYADAAWLSNARVQIASSHSNSRFYPDQQTAIRRFASVAKQKGMRLWNTEMHWNDNTRLAYVNAAKTLLAFFDHTDAGYSGFMWWGWNQDGARGLLQRAYLRSTLDARPITVTDRDGTGAVRNALTTRAYRTGNAIYLWVLNDTDKKVWNQHVFGTNSWRPTMDVWRQSGTELIHTRQTAQRMDNKPTFSFSPHTISLVRLHL